VKEEKLYPVNSPVSETKPISMLLKSGGTSALSRSCCQLYSSPAPPPKPVMEVDAPAALYCQMPIVPKP
jgi:hypothetical protein